MKPYYVIGMERNRYSHAFDVIERSTGETIDSFPGDNQMAREKADRLCEKLNDE